MKNRRNKKSLAGVRTSLADIESALNSIKWVEGSLTEFPVHIKKRLKAHLKNTGNENFSNSYWSPGKGTLQTKGKDEAHFELANGTLITEIGRFTYTGFKGKSQIIIVKIPHGNRVLRLIVATKRPRISEYKDRKDHVAYSWKTWLPSTPQYEMFSPPSTEDVLQVTYPLKTPPTPASVAARLHSSTQKESRQTSLEEYQSYWNRPTQSQWSPATTDGGDDIQHEGYISQRHQPHQAAPYGSYRSVGSSILQQPAGSRCSSNSSMVRSSPFTSGIADLPSESDEEYEDEVEDVEMTESEHDVTESSEDESSEAEHPDPDTDISSGHPEVHTTVLKFDSRIGGFRKIVNDSSLPTTARQPHSPQHFKSPVSDADSSRQPHSVIKIESEEPEEIGFDNVLFVFKDSDNHEQGRASFADCGSETGLFDEALASGIGINDDTRMLIVQIAESVMTPVRVDKRKVVGFSKIILNPLKNMLLDGARDQKIEVIVKHYY